MISGALAILNSEAERNEMSSVYEKNKALFLNIAFKNLQNKEMAEDAVQEAFLEIADKPEIFFSLSADKKIMYMSAVVKNVSIQMFNKSRRLQTEELSEDVAFRNDENLIENMFFDKLSRDEILAFIKTLSEVRRTVLTLSYAVGLSPGEISTTLNIPVSVVYKRLYAARKSVKKFIDERRKNNV